MTKKLVATVCMLVILVGVLTISMSPVQASQTDYLVGFARVDINPYVIDGDFDSGIMELPLRGSGDVWNRLSTYGLIDDNGDGRINEDDGLAVTCIAVTDSAGKTVLMITIDTIGGNLIDEVRTEICTRVEAALLSSELENVDLSKDGIYFAGTHTHNAPDVTVYNANGKTGFNNAGKDLGVINENLGIWIERTIEDVGDAAMLALQDRAPAKLVKDQISASESQSKAVKGKVMNTVRHYVNEAGGCVAGDNFNSVGSNPKQVTQVNDTMYLLQFDFSEHNAASDDDKLNIILANWRGHPSMNNSDTYKGGSRNCISSDYPNAFRHALEFGCAIDQNGKGTYDRTQDYRVAFFQAAGGNVNPRGQERVTSEYGTQAGSWIDAYATKNQECRGNGYGRVLAAMALEGIKTPAYREAVEPGNIRTAQYVYNSHRRTTNISALAYEAGKAYQATANPKHPFVYKNAADEVFVIGSKFHASNAVSSWDPVLQEPKSDLIDMELNVFMFGEGLAFVTAPGEPYDYYYNPDGSNAWDNLIAKTYGTPFVLGYCNGAKGYIPNSKAYDYNLGSEKWMRGSYESNITPYEQGTGEHMITLFGQMLDMLASGHSYSRQGMCQHCQTEVTWEPYNGQGILYKGHYYLRENTEARQIRIADNEQVCFDLNGYTLKSENRSFYTNNNGNAILNLMDTSAGQTGVVMGCGANYGVNGGYNGATIIVDTGNTMNFYSGTITAYQTGIRSVLSGGVVRNKGTVNMYGGVITGGVGYSFDGVYLKNKVPTPMSREGYGAGVYNTGVFNVYGGRIESGEFKLITGIVSGNETDGYTYSQTMEPCEGKGVCIYTSGTITVSADAQIADVYFPSGSGDLLHIDTTQKPFTGTLHLTYGSTLESSLQIGTCTEGTVFANGAITFSNGQLVAKVEGDKVFAYAEAAVVNLNGGFTYYSSFENAYDAYQYSSKSPSYIKLYADQEKDITISKTTYMDLNGFDITGKVTVTGSNKLYVMDSVTDDYAVEADGYGKITGKISGTVLPVPVGSVGAQNGEDYRFGYLAITEPDGVSFHRIKIQVTHITLRPDVAGIYYTGAFAGDELVAQNVLEYGIVLNAYEAPTAENIAEGGNNAIISSTETWSGSAQLVGAMLSGIMKEDNTDAQNTENAERIIYGCAYVKTESGYILSEVVEYNLRQLVEIADEYDVIQGEGYVKMTAMYQKYALIMEQWNLPRLRWQMQREG